MEPSQSPSSSQSINLMDLPSELHIQISTYLSYPDALALKHSSRHFYSIVYTGVRLKVDWFIERFENKLECPMEKCSFKTDESFCNGRVRAIMERRRWHIECRRARNGCRLVHGHTCQANSMSGWFKVRTPGNRRAVKVMKSWGHEALLIGIMTVLLNLLWNFVQR
ncbi:uncharacterized protein N7500_004523 [Penicillium coprophilum]|uniref:uncharacterized protein n=1 Tax=Penicillium coprophilum TaxID=36646 RepID=UPI00239998C7|nr:uncharacterized protein N7500_004523 [Penicillium coprophilum]KAJ5162693.1 hypothetical protein N7500_004523 [Penicillium coprophilum]